MRKEAAVCTKIDMDVKLVPVRLFTINFYASPKRLITLTLPGIIKGEVAEEMRTVP